MTPIPDRCGGSGRICWSDDSYASYNEPCTGCPDCNKEEPPMGWEHNESVRDEFRKPATKPTPQGVSAVLTVKLDVTRNGDTDPWDVDITDDRIDLTDPDGSCITFSRNGLVAAINIVQDYKR